MDDKLSVQVTGPALSFLYFASTSPVKAQEGFIFGEVEERRKEFISDVEDDGIKSETIIRVTGIFPNPGTLPFYNMDGTLNKKVFEKIHPKQSRDSNSSKLIGWFSCRKYSQNKPSFRETAIHSQLISELGRTDGKFIFVLVRNVLNPKYFIKEFSSKFFLLRDNRHWSLLSGSILNWNQKSNPHNTGSYRTLPTIESQLLGSLVEEMSTLGMNRLSECDQMEGIVSVTNNCQKQSLSNISKLSDDIARMESEISRLNKLSQVRQQMASVSDGEESFSDYPTSPLIGRRCQRVVSMEVSEVFDTAVQSSSSQEY